MSSSSSSSSSHDGEGAGGNGRGGRGGDFEGPSPSRRRAGNAVWPEPFIEALASQVAIEASRSFGRLAAAQALFNLFQVCSTWRAVSRSDLLWESLTRRIWNRQRLLHNTWRDEYTFRHRTTLNFRLHRYLHTTLHFLPCDDDNNDVGLSCRRLALSNHYLAAGLSDGSVRLFHLPSRFHLATFRPHHRDDRLGVFSRSVSGIILFDTHVIFASLDGDIHVAHTTNAAPTRRAVLGEVVEDGALVDFSGCNRWWVGLYAGVPGRSFHVWDGETEVLLYVGGTLTDPEAVMGWHLLNELTDLVGRVRVTSRDSAVACTSLRVLVFDLRNPDDVLGAEDFPTGLIVGTADANNEALLIVETRGAASVRRVTRLEEEVCRFLVRGAAQRPLLGCMNLGFALMCAGGVVRVWGIERDRNPYTLREMEGTAEEANAMAADDRHVAVYAGDRTIHLWDFGAQ